MTTCSLRDVLLFMGVAPRETSTSGTRPRGRGANGEPFAPRLPSRLARLEENYTPA